MIEWFVCLVCLVFSCLVLNPAIADPEPPAALARIVSVIGTSSAGHACPVTPELAITAGHVVESHRAFGPPDRQAYRGESSEWAGFLDPEFASGYEDAGFLRAVDRPFPTVFEFALRAPVPGERLWWVGYDWRKQKNAGVRRVFSGRVVAIVAGSIFFDAPTDPGSSGSCVLNSEGKIVAVTAWAMGLQDETRTAVAVGLWAPWFSGPPQKKGAQQ